MRMVFGVRSQQMWAVCRCSQTRRKQQYHLVTQRTSIDPSLGVSCSDTACMMLTEGTLSNGRLTELQSRKVYEAVCA